MRKQQKQQAEEMISILEEAHGEIKRCVEQNQAGIVIALLAQCQECAIKLGEMIEAEEGEGFVTIPFLEDYCERVYRIYEQVNKMESDQSGYVSIADNGNKYHKNLSNALMPVRNSIKNDIIIKREAVFLPYKASMWDSLESIWKAADEDPGCNAYVIPIPYYDRNADGSLGKMHYEGGEYPVGVPIVHYKEYDFQKCRPDMIFIHNPYDEYNRVTSVHPFFYSSNLKNLTEQLIYIPYFILEEINPQDKALVEGIKHFCTVPAVLHADRVIVQSEAMRRIYIDTMVENAGMKTKQHWENKILGLGSPKVDKVIGLRKEDIVFPESWRKYMYTADGKGKKVIFYNTSLNGVLQHRDKMIEKISFVFDVFKECRDEAVLLWRPHPLMEATIESMCPELCGAYGSLVRRYCEEGIGIYDDSADMNRALAASDAYYGDHSSLVQLCKMAGIPVMIQNVEIRGAG